MTQPAYKETVAEKMMRDIQYKSEVLEVNNDLAKYDHETTIEEHTFWWNDFQVTCTVYRQPMQSWMPTIVLDGDNYNSIMCEPELKFYDIINELFNDVSTEGADVRYR